MSNWREGQRLTASRTRIFTSSPATNCPVRKDVVFSRGDYSLVNEMKRTFGASRLAIRGTRDARPSDFAPCEHQPFVRDGHHFSPSE